MADYDLTRLGSSEFEHLAQALAVKHMGPNLRVFGSGQDGGREATTDQDVTWPDGTVWSGYTVVQAKFRERPRDVADNARWLRNEIRKELLAWTRTTRPRLPKPTNLLFITNVALSAAPGGGVDQAHAQIDSVQKKLPLVGRLVWHHDHLCRLLDDAQGIRTAFSGLITPGDVLSRLHDVLAGTAADLGGTLRRHAAKELLAEQWVRLGQSGSKNNERLLLGRVAVDLAAERPGADGEPESVHAVRHVLQVGDTVLRPSVRGNFAPPHIVLIGGPGQGKTTIGQLICQAYRVALLEDTDRLGPEVASALPTLRGQLGQTGLPVPAARRWPLRVDLSKYGAVLAGDEDTSLLRHIAEAVTDRAAETVTAAQLNSWLGSWPWLLVLDGLDEVVSAHVRETLVERVSDFLVDAASVDADLLIVATTRPRGYAGEFSPDRYEHLTLTDLDRSEALAYASRLADARHGDDPDVHRNVLERVAEASNEELTARLMRTPLQVTIMSLLLEGRARVPQNRHGLFDAYYDTIYNRETGKRTSTAALLEQHRATIDALHERVGLVLQVQAESDDRTEPVLPSSELRELALVRLTGEEHPADKASVLADKLVQAATERLVLIVPQNDTDVGFEVRSLQEFMAARALVQGPDQAVLDRLRRIAASSHWRNTWLLAAGRVAATRNHLVDPLIHLLADVDASDDLAPLLALGAELAADLLDDGFATTSPRVERLLLAQALQVLRRPLDAGTFQTAEILQRISKEGAAASASTIGDVAKQAFAADPPQRISAALMLRRWANGTGSLAVLGRQRVPNLQTVLGPAHHVALQLHFLGFTTPAGDAPDLEPRNTVADYLVEPPDLQPEDAAAVGPLRAQLRDVRVESVPADGPERAVAVVRRLRTPDQLVLEEALSRPAIATLVAATLLALDPADWAVGSAVTAIGRQWAQHRPAGQDLLTMTNPVRTHPGQHERHG